MLNNAKDSPFLAKGNGVDDDRDAIQAAIDDAKVHEKAGIFFPSGTYRVSNPGAPKRWSLDLAGVKEFTVVGEGPGSVVKLADTAAQTADWHVFILRDGSRRVTFSDLTVDGNRSGLTQPAEQSHGIEVEAGTEDLVIERCVLRDCFGDGVRLVGAAAANIRRVRIVNCLFQTNKRSGLAIQRALEQVLVADCIFDSTVTDQDIDFEPSGADAPTDLIVSGCIVNHVNATPAVTFSGIHGADPLIRAKFVNNIVIGGSVFSTDVAQLTVQGNVIVVPEAPPGNRVPLEVQRGGEALLITGNLLVTDNPGTEAALSLSEVNHRQVTRALVANNLCFSRANRGIQLLSSDDVAVEGNMIVATGPAKMGLVVRSESSDVDQVSLRNNDITVRGQGTWISGIVISASAPNAVDHVSVIANSVRGAGYGVVFDGPGFRRTPVCALNRIDSGVGHPLVGVAHLPEAALITGGAMSRGGSGAAMGAGRALAGLGDPNTRVAGNVGDIYQRLDGGDRSVLYVKESDATPNTGWNPK
jgi:hypothetical protein